MIKEKKIVTAYGTQAVKTTLHIKLEKRATSSQHVTDSRCITSYHLAKSQGSQVHPKKGNQ